MKLFAAITSNYYINVAVASWFIAQAMKVVLTFITSGKLVLERFVGLGGMPSSHAAFTVSLSVAMARKLGYDSPEFALVFAFTAVVLTDAMGVRRAAGEQAKVINRMVFEFSEFPLFLGKKQTSVEVPLEQLEVENPADQEEKPFLEKELKEFLGHTPLEVLGGCMLGFIVALLMPK